MRKLTVALLVAGMFSFALVGCGKPPAKKKTTHKTSAKTAAKTSEKTSAKTGDSDSSSKTSGSAPKKEGS